MKILRGTVKGNRAEVLISKDQEKVWRDHYRIRHEHSVFGTWAALAKKGRREEKRGYKTLIEDKYAELFFDWRGVHYISEDGVSTVDLSLHKFIKLEDVELESGGTGIRLVFDMDDFVSEIPSAVRYAYHFIPEESEETKISIGLNGFGSLLVMLGAEYGSKESIELAMEILTFKTIAVLDTLTTFGNELGTYRGYDPEEYFNSDEMKNLLLEDKYKDIFKTRGTMLAKVVKSPEASDEELRYIGNVSKGFYPVAVENRYTEPKEIDKKEEESYKELDYGYYWIRENYTEDAIKAMTDLGLFEYDEEKAKELYEEFEKVIKSFGNFA